MSVTPELLRNHGPTWGFRFLQNFQRLPRAFTRPLLMFGNWIAVARMPAQRRHSRDFLTLIHGRPVGLIEVWRHFFAYLELLLLRLRVAGGAPAKVALDPATGGDFAALMASGEPALFGTFHFGHSDLLGFLLPREGRRVAMMRLRVGNSADTDMFARQFAGAVSFIWVNQPEDLLFAMKAALDRGDSLAMQCDRFQFSSKTEAFDFLGARRMFPFTIYHVAVLFERPVIFCFGLPDGAGGTRVLATPLFRGDAALDRAANLHRARLHFQSVLAQLETLVRQHPLLWFNFLPLNPPEAPKPAATVVVSRGRN
jgi:predicted LPLAT superfamily acyltransferase